MVDWRPWRYWPSDAVPENSGQVDKICYRGTLLHLLVEGGRSSGAKKTWNRGLRGMV